MATTTPNADTTATTIAHLETFGLDDVRKILDADGFDPTVVEGLANTLLEDPDLDWLTGDQRTEHIYDLLTGVNQ